jgi:UDP-glucose 4-epimerase
MAFDASGHIAGHPVHLVSGGCGFVGRHLVQRLLMRADVKAGAAVVVVDDLSTGQDPAQWLSDPEGRVKFVRQDFRAFLRTMGETADPIRTVLGLDAEKFTDVYHFAAIVGGRVKIDGDPMAVAVDLAIDAELFAWVVRHRPARVLYPSSSAAYPISLQAESGAIALPESAIPLSTDGRITGNLGQPDMTYGWSKLTGEYLARIAAAHYGLHVACVRPFSGYGEDQDLSYPIPAIALRAARREDPFEVWGTGHQGRDFVHIDDCIDAIELAMDKISDGSAINIGSGRLTSFREIIALMTEFAGYAPEIKALVDKPVGVHSRYAEPSHAASLGFTPKVSLREGMRRVYDAAVARG